MCALPHNDLFVLIAASADRLVHFGGARLCVVVDVVDAFDEKVYTASITMLSLALLSSNGRVLIKAGQ